MTQSLIKRLDSIIGKLEAWQNDPKNKYEKNWLINDAKHKLIEALHDCESEKK